MIYRRALFVLIAAAALVLSGCASTMSAEQKASVRTVALAKTIDLPSSPTVIGSNSGGAFLLAGPLGVLIEQKASDLPTKFSNALASNQIDVGVLLRDAIKARLVAQGYTVIDDASRADAVFTAKVGAYGMTGNIFSAEEKRFPLLSTLFEMRRRGTDELLWRRLVPSHTLPAIMDQQDQRPLADYFNDGALLRREHVKITALVAGHAFRDF